VQSATGATGTIAVGYMTNDIYINGVLYFALSNIGDVPLSQW
jgi:hypothetical protein